MRVLNNSTRRAAPLELLIVLTWILVSSTGCMASGVPGDSGDQTAIAASPVDRRAAVTVEISGVEQATLLPATTTRPPKEVVTTVTVTEARQATLLSSPSMDDAVERDSSSACSESLPSRLSVRILARVTFTNGLPLRVRKQPGADGQWIESMDEGTRMSIEDGPVCMDGFYWWQIESEDGLRGWAAEADAQGYFIEPLTTGTVGEGELVCNNSLPSRVSVGDSIVVITYQVAVRNAPGTTSSRTDVLAHDRTMQVLDGPGCADGMWWWFVQAETGASGWVAEGDAEDYYIMPQP